MATLNELVNALEDAHVELMRATTRVQETQARLSTAQAAVRTAQEAVEAEIQRQIDEAVERAKARIASGA